MAKFSFPKPGEMVRDIEGRCYRLIEQLNEGRQGVVFTTEDASILVKVCRPPQSRHTDETRKQLHLLTRRKLDINSLVLPRAVLNEPYLGYVMDRVQDSIPLSNLVYPHPRDRNPNWHASTGGLRRRLRICAELARTFEQIHRNGLCYVDLSWQNVLVPSDPTTTSIKLIDPDNLIIPGTSLAEVIGTEQFIAPELLKESRFPNHASDRWSLAVAIFYLLVLNHPFFSDEVIYGEPELEEIALRGELPFIYSQDNYSKFSSPGLLRSKVLTRRLQKLCIQAFESGVLDPWARPSPEEWLSALEEAADQTALCPKCNATSYLPDIRGASLVCDWCGETSDRPIELGFFDSYPSIDDLNEDEIKELKRIKKSHRFVLDKRQKMLPKRLVDNDIQATGYVAQFGSPRNSSGYALKNLSQDTWYTKDARDQSLSCPPGENVWLFDKTLIVFPSGIRAKVRNPSRGSQL